MRFLLLSALTVSTGVILLSTALSPSKALFTSQASNQGNIVSSSTLSTPSPSTTPSPIPSPTPFVVQPGDVVINEINWAGNNDGGVDEWIELLNMTNQTILIGNWIIENAGETPNSNLLIATGSSIPANGFFLISNNIATLSRINVEPDMVTTAVSLDNDGEQLRLKTNTNITIDTANGLSNWFSGRNTPLPKASMERKTSPGDGTVGTNWTLAITNTNMDSASSSAELGTPKAPNGL